MSRISFPTTIESLRYAHGTSGTFKLIRLVLIFAVVVRWRGICYWRQETQAHFHLAQRPRRAHPRAGRRQHPSVLDSKSFLLRPWREAHKNEECCAIAGSLFFWGGSFLINGWRERKRA